MFGYGVEGRFAAEPPPAMATALVVPMPNYLGAPNLLRLRQ
jgi:hypothetical protein